MMWHACIYIISILCLTLPSYLAFGVSTCQTPAEAVLKLEPVQFSDVMRVTETSVRFDDNTLQCFSDHKVPVIGMWYLIVIMALIYPSYKGMPPWTQELPKWAMLYTQNSKYLLSVYLKVKKTLQ